MLPAKRPQWLQILITHENSQLNPVNKVFITLTAVDKKIHQLRNVKEIVYKLLG